MFKRLIYLISFFSLAAVLPAGATETERDQRKFDYFFYGGLNLKSAGKFDATYDTSNHCLETGPTAAPILYELSSFYVQLNRPEKTAEILKRAVTDSEDNFACKMALAFITRNLGMYGEAAGEYEELVRDYPEKEELNYYLADALTQAGEIGKATEAYDALESVTGMNEAIFMQRYKLYVQLEEPEEALKEIEKLVAKYPMGARCQIVSGDFHLENGETDKALACYQRANGTDPTDSYYIVFTANYYEAKGDKEAAEQQIRSVLVNEKLDVETEVNILFRYILKLQQTKRGTENTNHLFQTLLEQHPEDIDLKLMYGGLLAAQGKTGEVRFQFQLVAEVGPGNVGAWQQLLNLALKGKDIPETIRICTTCMELFPESPGYCFYLGVACY